MKTMKWILLLGMTAALVLATMGCSDSDKKDGLEGTWRAESFNGQPLGNDIAMTITFRDNGSFTVTTTIGGATETDTGTWSAGNGVLTTVTDGEVDTTPYTLSGNTMTLGDANELFVLRR